MTAARLDPVWDAIRECSTANNDEDYGHSVAKWSLGYYRKRLRQVGLSGLGSVLDVGCGFGQWVVALAAENERACGIEINRKRLETSEALIRSLWLDNAEVREGSATTIPYPDNSFDGVMCYGVFMFVDRAAALAEFHRVLRPGGLLYVSTNARGWWLQLAAKNLLKNRAMVRTASRAFLHGRRSGLPNATDLRDVPALLAAPDWVNVTADFEGVLRRDRSRPHEEPVYRSKFLGYESVIDISARSGKSGADGPPKIASRDLVQRRVDEILAADRYDYVPALVHYNTVDHGANSAVVTNKAAVAYSLEISGSLSRLKTLQTIFAKITAGLTDDSDRIRTCITFAQKAFYHHFTLQPMLDESRMLLDPIASLIFGACRCGNVARFLIDLFESGGMRARLLAGSCHTFAEVHCGDRWIIADASLYPPGIFPVLPDGRMPDIQDVVDDPGVLDRVPCYINVNVHHGDMAADLYPLSYARIERYVRCTILPSVGYFGKEFGGDGAGKIRRWRKRQPLSALEEDPDAGWGDLVEEDPVIGRPLPTVQRPEQVRRVERHGRSIVWEPAYRAQPGTTHYDLFISDRTRGWDYSSIPVGCDFTLPGVHLSTSDCEIQLPDQLGAGTLFLSVVARRSDDAQEFNLPSEEFRLDEKSGPGARLS